MLSRKGEERKRGKLAANYQNIKRIIRQVVTQSTPRPVKKQAV